jgi:hypothetical protein
MLCANEQMNLNSIKQYRRECLGEAMEMPIEELMHIKPLQE